MGLASLDICDFRNIQQTSLSFSPGLNLIFGENAAGKTSLLEAIYYLGRVRSFRTHQVNQPIRDGKGAFRLVGRLLREEGRVVPIGIERQSSGLQVHLDGQVVRRLSDLAGSFPVQAISGDTSTILSGGPRYRRQTLDWALFHVEQAYRDIWQHYTRSLRQRNAALRAQMPANQITTWDSELLESAAQLHQFRRLYFETLLPHLQTEVRRLLPSLALRLSYQPGWPADATLSEALGRGLEKDRALGSTQYGPHRADFKLTVSGKPVQSHCSRGQQKAVIVAFMLAQVKCQQDRESPLGAFLLDDLGSELDAVHQARVLESLRQLGIQVFVTAIGTGPDDLSDWQDKKRFHVERGEIQEVV
ncbi:MAG: DNA replication/repair protein RecF [Pseudomonadota bacterium]